MSDTAYKVFLSYNSADREFVRQVASRLDGDGITCFFDEARLVPGDAWPRELEDALWRSGACVIFIGTKGWGKWQEFEKDAAIAKYQDTQHEYRVIPVLLPDAGRPEDVLPPFLRQFECVNFYKALDQDLDAYDCLKRGILGLARGLSPRPSTVPTADEPPIVPRGLRSFEEGDAWFFLRLVPDAWGLFDMHGSMWEWCQDWHGVDYYTRVADESRTKASASPVDDPPGPTRASSRAIRGGSWASGAENCRSAFRGAYEPAYRYQDLGFRVAAVPLHLGPDAAQLRP